MCVFVYCFGLCTASSPSLLSLLSFLSPGVCYFSPVIRHVDSSLSLSNTTEINFPAGEHMGGLQSGPHLCHTHFIHPHTHRRTPTCDTYRSKHAGRWFTTTLFSNVLLASSLQHPFVFADRSWQQHLSILALPSLRQPTPFLSAVTSSPCWTQSFRAFLRTSRTEHCACEWLLY